ncbi:MAG: hypothetical protein KDI67_02370 [Gammaproteobacteria bacterium]|nr:hypothetical protein [Gammaproteobacteria bacterium]
MATIATVSPIPPSASPPVSPLPNIDANLIDDPGRRLDEALLRSTLALKTTAPRRRRNNRYEVNARLPRLVERSPMGWRPEGWPSGGFGLRRFGIRVSDDLLEYVGILDASDDAHRSPAGRAGLGVNPE